MKLPALLILSFLLISCKKEIGNDVRIEILNKELYFNGKYINNHSSNQSYKNDIDRKNARNILTWKLTNNSDSNYLFVISEDDFYENPNFYYDSKHIEITNDKNDKRLIGGSDIMWSGINPGEGELYGCFAYNDSLSKSYYKLKGINKSDYALQSNYVKNSFVLHPDETKTFRTILFLPILKEINPITLESQIIVNTIQKRDLFNLVYELDSIKTKKGLQKYQIDELKANKVKIFNGKLVSNKVPLISRE